MDKKTPCNDNQRCFGEFRCPKCNRKWMSANAWANSGQECMDCGTNVYPFRKAPLEKPGGMDKKIDSSKDHVYDLCQMCKKLGRHCNEIESI